MKIPRCESCTPAIQAECRDLVREARPVLCERQFIVPVVDRAAAVEAGFRPARSDRAASGPVEAVYANSRQGDSLLLMERPAGRTPFTGAAKFILTL